MNEKLDNLLHKQCFLCGDFMMEMIAAADNRKITEPLKNDNSKKGRPLHSIEPVSKVVETKQV
jgi:hypothetical protein